MPRMTELDAYLARKHEELRLLAEYAGMSPKQVPPPRSLHEVVRAKQQMRFRTRQANQLAPGLSESNMTGNFESLKVFGYDFAYDYQRLGVKLNSKNAFKDIYFGQKLAHEYESKGYFASSCQVAISLCFDTLTMLGLPKKLAMSPNAYWEALRYFKVKGWKLADNAEILYIDSSTDDNEGRKLGRVKIAFIDTTCLPLQSRTLSEWIDRLLKHKIPCVLLRSHMKLDCMGIEYGRLGSAVLLMPANIDRKRRQFCLTFWEKLEELSRLYGAYASLSQLYPFLKSKRFHDLNAKRLKAITENNTRVALRLKEIFNVPGRQEHVEIQSFKHGCFFWIRFKEAIDKKSFVAFSKKLRLKLRYNHIPFRFVASYPWDYFAFSYFAPEAPFSLDQGTQTILRPSLPDVPREYVDRYADCVIEWLLHHLKTKQK